MYSLRLKIVFALTITFFLSITNQVIVDTYVEHIHQLLYKFTKKTNEFYFGTDGVLFFVDKFFFLKFRGNNVKMH